MIATTATAPAVAAAALAQRRIVVLLPDFTTASFPPTASSARNRLTHVDVVAVLALFLRLEDAAHERDQLHRIERFGEVAVAVHLPAPEYVGILRLGRQHDDRQIAGAW